MTNTQHQTYRPFTALLLVVVLCNSLFVNELHHLIGHNHDDKIKCQAQGNEKHFHQDNLSVDPCFVCNFNFSPLEETGLNVLQIAIPDIERNQVFNFNHIAFSKEVMVTFLRGPPNSFMI